MCRKSREIEMNGDQDFDRRSWAKSIDVPTNKPASRPTIKARRWNQLVYNPRNTGGSVWIIQILPTCCKLIAMSFGKNRIKANAPTFTSSENTLAVLASWRSVQEWLMNSR